MNNKSDPLVRLTKLSAKDPTQFTWFRTGYWAIGPLTRKPEVGKRTGIRWIEKSSNPGDGSKYVSLTEVQSIAPVAGTTVHLHTLNSVWKLEYL